MPRADLLWMPFLNACLNGAATVLLVLGWRRIRAGDPAGHRARMLGAVGCSAAFLASYLVFHALAGSKRFWGDGALRTTYLAILLSHTVLAVAMAFLVPRTLFLAFKGRLAEHRRIARYTLAIWLYVSVTGVVIYVMNYTLDPSA